MKEAYLHMAQRLSAMVLAPLTLLHVGVTIHAVRDGLDAAEILARTEGSVLWGAVYGLFVVAVAVHAPLGLRAIVREWAGWRGPGADAATAVFALGLLVLGMRAVDAVV